MVDRKKQYFEISRYRTFGALIKNSHKGLAFSLWDAHYPSISNSWRAHWARAIPLFAFPEDIRKVIYTTNAVESLNMTLRKVTRNHRIFPSDEAVYKVVYLAMRNIAKKWTMPIRDWKPALNRFAVEFEGRFPR